MAGTNDEWELSKENIQPIQQGRKPEVLKVALATQQPEDQIALQKQAFENELRTYTGDDPLGVWYQYIKWVEQVFPKGGRDGHLHQLIRQCLSQLIKETQYYNDKRFIKIWLKYANTSLKAAEVYENMYSRNIGCIIASFFMAWSWELEQQGNFKKANEIINDGIQRRAEPLERLKAYRSEFEIRVASKVMSGVESNNDQDEENGRSAFSVLKPQKKKNMAPVVRTGASIMEPNRSSVTLGRQQPMPRSNVPAAKVPFKIYNAENLPPALPIQSENPPPFTLYTDTSKENEKKPSKWNKVKVKQVASVVRPVSEATPGFKLHCDEDTQPESTPRSITKVSNVLRVCKLPSSPEMAQFEEPDPMKRAMYDKIKVYGGGEEFSLEEIRAAAWFKKEKERKLVEQLQEQQALIKSLEQKVQLLQTEVKKPNVAVHSDSSQNIEIYEDPSSLKEQENFNHNSEPYIDPCNPENLLIEMKKEDIENVPPKDYVKTAGTKRELAGILQPSKNIMFIPLEDQYEEEDSEPESEDEGLYKENNNHPLQDETLIPPCNTEQFVSAAFLASTPRTQIKSTKYMDLHNSNKEEVHDCIGKSDDSTLTHNVCNMVALQAPLEEMADSGKQVYKPEAKTSMRDQSTIPGLQGQLSVILETSRECYKSSSSSGSSASVTRLSQFSQCYSHEKSNIQKHLSKTDVFKEPRPVSHSKDLSSGVPRDSSLCAYKDTKSVCLSAEEKEIFEIHCTDLDPFDETLRNNFLKSISKSQRIFETMHVSTKPIKAFKAKDQIEFGGITYVIDDLVAEGAYGKVYKAGKQYSLEQNFDSADPNSKNALKASKGSSEWEYYICTILHKRFNESNSLPDVRPSIMELLSACRFSNGTMLVSEFNHQGTLLDLVNLYKKQNSNMPETFAFYLTLEILQMVGKMHECNIIHGDIKPDNILVQDNMWSFNVLESLGQKTSVLKLIDFGRAIDLKAFKSGVCFKTITKENCIEMRENKPWVFQLDWYGVLNCIHIILFSEYMKVRQNKNGRWEIEKRIKRYWDQTIWVSLFDELLNIPSCYNEPNLEKFTNMIISKLRKNETSFITYFKRLANLYGEKTL